MMTLLANAAINARIRYGNLAHVCDGCRQQLYIQNCGQTAANRDIITLTAYKSSLSPYPIVPSLTHYDVPVSHNICITDDRL